MADGDKLRLVQSTNNINYNSVITNQNAGLDYSNAAAPPAGKPELNKTNSELLFLSSDIGRIERSRRLDSVYVLISPNHSDLQLCDLQCVYYKLMLELGMTVDQFENEKELVTVVSPPDELVFRAAEETMLGMPMAGTFKVGFLTCRTWCSYIRSCDLRYVRYLT